jgi:peptide chain release factor 3
LSQIEKEIAKRRTFGIISHPDAGKTTITEKLLLYGGAIQMAGMVKDKRKKHYARSDWMEIERQRGISVTSSVLNFPYGGCEINLIDTPGHQDFSEDTYRTLTAVDSALMLIDAANGVEAQTRKLFSVCRMRAIPILGFINKMDRPGRDPFALIDEIEKVLGIGVYPMTWPIGSGDLFRGVWDRHTRQILLYEKGSDKSRPVAVQSLSLQDESLIREIGHEAAAQLAEDIEMLDMAGESFEVERYRKGEICPVFFGSALNNFGVQTLLDTLVELAPPPLPRETEERVVMPEENKFSAFIFKVQANMDPNHRDRVAFMRICSGKFERNMKAFHVRHEREQRLGRPTQFLAQDRSLVDEAFAGDIVGIHDPGLFKIGDSLSEGEKIHFTGIPVFAPEHFARVVLKDPLKSKQLHKAVQELSEEGVVQVLRPLVSTDRFLGVVGQLQLEVIKFRIEHEYGINIILQSLPYSLARWIVCDDKEQREKFIREQENHISLDRHDAHVMLIDEPWRVKFLTDRYPKVSFATIGKV